MANVRFFRLSNLPSFSPAYRGIFVYVPESRTLNTGESLNIGWSTVYPVPSDLQGTIPGTSTPYTSVWGSTYVPAWQNGSTAQAEALTFTRFYDENAGGFICSGEPVQKTGADGDVIEKGLWFGGEHGWELLSNGEADLSNLDVNTLQTVENSNDQNGNVTLTFKGVRQTDGLIGQGDGAGTVTVGNGKLKISGSGATDTTGQNPSIPSAVTTDVHSANSTADSTVTLDGSLVWSSNTIGVRTKTPVSASNLIMTADDVAGISGSMRLKGGISSEAQLPSGQNAQDGDTYIVTSAFTTTAQAPTGWSSGIVFESGDTIVRLGSNWSHIQGNLTVGVEPGQVAPVSSATGNTLSLSTGETNKLVATDGSGLVKTAIDPDSILTSASGDGRDLALSVTPQGQLEIEDTVTIGGDDYASNLTVSSPNTSIVFTADDTNDAVTVNLVWMESL